MANFKDEDFEIVYPGKFLPKEKEAVKAYQAKCDYINNRGPFDIQAFLDGKLADDTPDIGAVINVTENMIRYNHSKYEQDNPLYNDKEYAQKCGYVDIPAYFTFGSSDDIYVTPYIDTTRDTLLVSQISHSTTNVNPVYPGDTLYLIRDRMDYQDLTPFSGSIHRTMALRQEGTVYNQRAEVVNKVTFSLCESVRFFKEGKKPENMDFSMIWQAPDWLSRPSHYYTDEDYAWMKEIWKKEEIRGAEPRYWESVRIGDRPNPTLEGPIIDSVLPSMPFGMGAGGSKTIRNEFFDPEKAATMIRDENGIYKLPNRKDYVPAVPDGVAAVFMMDDGRKTDAQLEEEAANAPSDGTIDAVNIHKSEDRAAMINFFERDCAIHHFNNWMGDAGKITEIKWSIMPSETHAAYGLPVPKSPNYNYYVCQVPGMEDKIVDTHGLTRDIAYIQSEVVDKYMKTGRYFVKLIWWVQTITGEIWADGSVEIELPHMN